MPDPGALSSGKVVALPLDHVFRAATDLVHLKPLLTQRWAPDAIALGTRVAYLWCPNGLAKNALWTAADRALNRTGTARNISTFTKVLALMENQSA